MTRSRTGPKEPARITIPPAEPLNNNGDGGGDLPNDDVDLESEVGDLIELADASYADWKWYVYRFRNSKEMAANPKANHRLLVTRLVGPIDILDFQTRFGGGEFEFWGYFDGRLRKRERHELDGPIKTYDPTPPTPPAAAVAPVVPDRASEQVLAYLQQLERKVERLQERIENGGGEGQVSLAKELIGAFKAGAEMRGGNESGGELLKEIVSAFKTGAELRGSVEGGSDKSTLEIVVEKLAPSIEKIATMALSRRAQMVRRPQPTPSSAIVVADPATPAEPPPPPPGEPVNHRWATAIESLASAIAEGDDPADFAITLERILNKQEVAQLRFAALDDVMVEIIKSAGETYPVLKSEPARVFIEAVLSEIKNPTADDEQ